MFFNTTLVPFKLVPLSLSHEYSLALPADANAMHRRAHKQGNQQQLHILGLAYGLLTPTASPPFLLLLLLLLLMLWLLLPWLRLLRVPGTEIPGPAPLQAAASTSDPFVTG